MKLKVVIRNTSPIFSAATGENTIDIKGNIGVPNGLPFSRTRTMLIMSDRGETPKPVHVPVVPGNTMRNLLRRTMLDELIMPTLKGKGALSIGAYAAAYAGNASGNPEGVPATFDETLKVRNHAFLGLFGGGPRMMEGRLRMDSLYPIHVDALRVIGEGFEEHLSSGKITDIVWQRRTDPVLKIKEESTAEIIKDGPAAITQWAVNAMGASLERAQKRKAKNDEDAASEGPSVRGLAAFNAHEVVIPGIDWLQSMTLVDPSPAQVGLVLLALAKMPNKAIAGGHAKGYGAFDIRDIQVDGTSVWDGAAFADSEQLHAYFDAAMEAMDQLSTEEFESFVATSKDRDEA